MVIHFNKKIEKSLSSKEEIKKNYTKFYKKIVIRLSELSYAKNLASIPTMKKPARKHKLSGDLKEYWSVDISPNYRLLFKPYYSNVQDESKITEIQIEKIIDDHK